MVPYGHANATPNSYQNQFASYNTNRKYYNDPKNFDLPKSKNEFYNETMNNCKTLNAQSQAYSSQPLPTPIIYNYNNISAACSIQPVQSASPPSVAHSVSSIPIINNDYLIQKPPVLYSNPNNGNNGTFKKMKMTNNSSPDISNHSNGPVENLNDTIEFSTPKRQIDLTPEQLKTLYEEPVTTENAMVAVMGYDPQDDKKICKFYDATINGCFKGFNCNKLHIPKLAGKLDSF